MGDWKDSEDCYSAPDDRYACPSCVTDPYLAAALAADLEDEPCSYCGADRAASISVLCVEIGETLTAYYTDPAEVLGYCSGEGGYQGEVLSGSRIVADEFAGWTECDELADDVARAFARNVWCERNYYGLSHYETLYYSWQDFSEQVKHSTRYLFLQEMGTDSEYNEKIAPGEMLDALGQLFQEFDLFYELPQSTDLFRARAFSASSPPATAAELGTAPREAATRPNRMSPAGIPMFYGALDEATAVLETYGPKTHPGKKIAVACFRNNRPLLLLDLTNLPAVPSIFDLRMRYEHPRLLFLRDFETEFVKPVDREEDGHTEYVPTQVVTEYVRHRLRTSDGRQIDGIYYRSSRKRDSTAVVIFADPEHCGPRSDKRVFAPEPFLELIGVRYATYDDIRKEQPHVLWPA
jgi:hypothetical protein